MRKADDDSVRLLIQGLYRFRLERWVGQDPFLVAEVTPIPEEYEPSLEVDALVSNVKGLFLKMLELSPYLPSELGNLVRELSDPRVLADITAGSLNISKTEKQELLETIDVGERLRRVLTHINRELEILELGKKIQSQVKSDMDKTQKDYYLREHIKALQKELGEGDDPTREVDELQFRLEEAELPAHAMKEAERELNRLKRTPPTLAGSPGHPQFPGVAHRPALEQIHRRQPGPAPGPGDPGRGPLQPGKGEEAHPGIPGGAQTQARHEGAHPLLRGAAGHRQDLPGPLHRPGPGPQVRAPLPGRGAGRSRDQGPPPHLRGGDARPHHPVHAPGRLQ